jgi:serine/threonine protein kinase
MDGTMELYKRLNYVSNHIINIDIFSKLIFTLRDQLVPRGKELIGVSNKTWIVGNEIARGSSSAIYACENNDSVVIKIDRQNIYLEGDETDETDDNYGLENEIIFYESVLHTSSKIPKYFDRGVTNDHIIRTFIVIEKFEMDLEDWLLANSNNNNNTPFNCFTASLKLIVADVITSIAYVHSQGFVHADIGAENIFIKNGKTVLGDFGEAHNKLITRELMENDLIRLGSLMIGWFLRSDGFCDRMEYPSMNY